MVDVVASIADVRVPSGDVWAGTSQVKRDAIVVGGGAIGASIALELARYGATVTLVERDTELSQSASAGNAGYIVPSHASPLATPANVRSGLLWMLRRDSPLALSPRPVLVPWLARFLAASTPAKARRATNLLRRLSVASLELHAEWAADGLQTGFSRTGILNTFETDRSLEAGYEEAALHREAGLATEVLDATAARELEPALRGPLSGAVYYPSEATCDPMSFLSAVSDEARRLGADLRLGVQTRRLLRQRERVVGVATTAGTVYADVVVVAAGAWSKALAAAVGVKLPIEGGKGYHVDLLAAPGHPRLPVFLQDARVTATPLMGRLRLTGMLELSGLDLRVKQARVDAVVGAARRAFGLDRHAAVLDVWRGLRPCAPDGLPLVGPAPGLEGLLVATGHSMLGLTLAPLTGRLVAGIVAGHTPHEDLLALDPGRFGRGARARRRDGSPCGGHERHAKIPSGR